MLKLTLTFREKIRDGSHPCVLNVVRGGVLGVHGVQPGAVLLGVEADCGGEDVPRGPLAALREDLRILKSGNLKSILILGGGPTCSGS